jgi:hypothetical protein
LERMTDQEGSLCYQLGLYINLNHGQFNCTWFKNGQIAP